MTKRESTMNRIANCFKEVSLGKVVSINSNDRLEEDLGIDSMGATDLVFSLEDEFNISISDPEMYKIKTVDDIIDLILSKEEATAVG